MFCTRNLLLTAATLAMPAGLAAAQATITEVFTEADAAGDVVSPFLDTVATDGGTKAYAVIRESDGGGGAPGAGNIVEYDGLTDTFTVVSSLADWTASGFPFDPAAGEGANVVGGVLRAVSFFENNVYEVNLTTGVVSEVVSKATLDAVAGVSVNMVADFEVLPSGQIFALDGTSDQILSISPTNVVTVEINTADLAAAIGGTSFGGIGVAGTDIYLGSNGTDELVVWDTITDSASTVLTTAEIDAVTDDIDGTVGFGDIFFAPDGLVYFYETDSDFLLAFDPDDPLGTLDVIATEADFAAGPSSDTINQLAWFDGQIAFTDGSVGFYTIPEPATVALLAIGGALIAGRGRRA